MKRLAEFLRSVLPADLAQLLFLAGTVCLVIASRLSWWPAGFQIDPEHRGDWLNRQIGAFSGVIFFPMRFAGIAAYFTAFWPGPQPVRRILSCVYLPTVPILAILCLRFVHLVSAHRSVLETVGPHSPLWPESPLLKVPGLQFCLMGLLLIGIFTVRLIAGRSSLPLALPAGSRLSHDDPGTWRRIQTLIWVLVGPLFLTMAYLITPLLRASRWAPYFFSLSILAYALVMLGIALCVIGKSAAPMVRNGLRLPGEKYALLAVLFPIGIPSLIALGQYVGERAQLVRHDVGTVVWEPGTYFHFPEAWVFLLFFPALLEEIIFRGFLQPRFVQRYGLLRGIFLVGIVWAAFHFPSDMSFSHFGFWAAIRTVCFRLFMCIGLSFVLGWLTLETGSVLAAALAHTLYNALTFSELGPPFPGKDFLLVALWAALGWILFRYWPAKPELPESLQVTKAIEQV
jgi:membrane protease YdiL (CAAX protease family)